MAGDGALGGSREHAATAPEKVCIQCGTTKTPMWRNSTQGPKTMCNACGVKLQRAQNKLRAQALAAGEPEPVFPATIGAPRHRKAAPVPRTGHGASASRTGPGAAAAGPVTRQRQPGKARGRTRAETAATGDAAPLPAPVVRSVAPDAVAAPTAVAPAPLVPVRAEQAAPVKAPAVVFADGSAITRTSLGPLAGLKRSSSAVGSSASAASVAVALSEGTAPSAAARQRHVSTKRPKTQAQPAPETSEGVHLTPTQHRQQQAAACQLPQQKQQQGSLLLSPFAAATAQRLSSTTATSLDPSLAPTLSHLELLLPRDGRLAHRGLPRRTSGVLVRVMSPAGSLGPYQGSGYQGSGRVLGIFSCEGRELLSTASPNGRFRSSPTSDIVTWTHAEGWTLVFPSQDDWTVFKGLLESLLPEVQPMFTSGHNPHASLSSSLSSSNVPGTPFGGSVAAPAGGLGDLSPVNGRSSPDSPLSSLRVAPRHGGIAEAALECGPLATPHSNIWALPLMPSSSSLGMPGTPGAHPGTVLRGVSSAAPSQALGLQRMALGMDGDFELGMQLGLFEPAPVPDCDQDDTPVGGSMRRRSLKLESTAVLPMGSKGEESLIYKHSGLLNSSEAQLMHNGIGPAASMLGPLDQAHPLQGLPVGW